MNTIRQIIRGCGTLPHVGEHPGTMALFAFALMGALAGGHAGWRGVLMGATFMLGIFGPMYLYGAWERAKVSDRMAGK